MGSTPSREHVLKKFGYICQYCGSAISTDTFSRDHIIPVVKGGRKIEHNLILCCTICNGKKDKRSLESYRTFLYEEVYDALMVVEKRLLRWNAFSPESEEERRQRAAIIADLSRQLQHLLSTIGVHFPIDEKLKHFTSRKRIT